MVADTMRPSRISTDAWMSPCRLEPQPRYVPSFQWGAAAVVAVGAAAGAAGAGEAAAGAVTGSGVTAATGGSSADAEGAARCSAGGASTDLALAAG